ncbi:hypothetical protein D3C85_1578820 [compost metagenome]
MIAIVFGDVCLGRLLILQHVEAIGVELNHLLLVLEQANITILSSSKVTLSLFNI